MNDLELLREYEPVVCFTQGELFFPLAVDQYVRRCALLPRVQDRATPVASVVAAGELTVDRLASEAIADVSRTLNLRFIEVPLTGAAYKRWLRRQDRPAFQTSGRLGRVGLGPRFVDSLFSLSLLLRGSVPGGTAAAAEVKQREIRAVAPEYVYHGRVVRERGYIVLHYLFFYVMNDWRSTYAGVNDHEADWEQVFVYLNECADAPPRPAWIAYASHDYHGDDLRRRWDDPEITIEGTHPVVFAGAGSHASYFKPGEYLTSVPMPYMDRPLKALRSVRHFWRDVLGQGGARDDDSLLEGLLRIPFVDYARGDGRAIGPGRPDGWTPVVISEAVPWVENYRGLWGLDTRDPLSGELAPSGPKYNRDGSVRQSWHDPLGWAGLAKVAPASDARRALTAEIAVLEAEFSATGDRLAALDESLPRLDLEVRALHGVRYLNRLHRARGHDLIGDESERTALRTRQVELQETLTACRLYLARLEAGIPDGPHAHLHHAHEPEPPSEIRRSKAAETWAGLSVGLLLLGVVFVTFFSVGNWGAAVLLVIGAVMLVESILHRTVGRLLLNLTVTLALVTAAVLAYAFYRYLLLAGITALAVIILRDNLREIRRL